MLAEHDPMGRPSGGPAIPCHRPSAGLNTGQFKRDCRQSGWRLASHLLGSPTRHYSKLRPPGAWRLTIISVYRNQTLTVFATKCSTLILTVKRFSTLLEADPSPARLLLLRRIILITTSQTNLLMRPTTILTKEFKEDQPTYFWQRAFDVFKQTINFTGALLGLRYNWDNFVPQSQLVDEPWGVASRQAKDVRRTPM